MSSLVELPVAGASSAMALPQALYRASLRALRAVSPAMMRGESKLARGLRGRRDAHERLAAWGHRGRSDAHADGDGDSGADGDAGADSDAGAAAAVLVDPPVVWVHASSLGESIQARAVIDVLRRRVPGLQVVFTFFSPSAEVVCGDFPADVCCYLPWDLPEVMGPVLDAVRPSLIAFTQREVWPTLAEEAATRLVPTVLMAGMLPEGAGRLSWPGRLLLGAAFRSLRAVGAVSKEDGERFGLLGVRGERVTVTGDPAVDAARARVAAIDHGAPHLRIFREGRGPILVAGSTWPSDEEVLLPALARVRESVPGLKIVLAPHEPDGYDFAGLGRRLAADGWTPALLGEAEGAGEAGDAGEAGCAEEAEGAGEVLEVGTVRGADAILVDRIGVLADLYSLATVAYVGGGFHTGGFHRGGLHSVIEPAAAGVGVLIGPRYRSSVHAMRLLAAGAARVIADADGLTHALEEWLQAPNKNDDPGRHAMDYIEDHRGSAECAADLITQFLPRQNRRGTLSEGQT